MEATVEAPKIQEKSKVKTGSHSLFAPYSMKIAHLLAMRGEQIELLKEYLAYPAMRAYIVVEKNPDTNEIINVLKKDNYPTPEEKERLIPKGR